MDSSRPKHYARRIQRILDYMETHLDEDLSLESMAELANFSSFHFHRQFTAYTGITMAKFVRLLRLRRASMRLAFLPDFSVLDIAIEAGFESAEGFSRAFKSLHGQSPSEFRAAPIWESWQRTSPVIKKGETMCTDHSMGTTVEVVDFPETRVAAVEYQGPQAQELKATRQLVAWRRENRMPPDKGSTFGIHYSDPMNTPEEEYRFDVCVSYDQVIDENPHGVVAKTIPAGRCAKVRHLGSRDYIGAVAYLYQKWLPESGEELRDFPVYFHYVNVGPDVSPQDMITDVYLPLT